MIMESYQWFLATVTTSSPRTAHTTNPLFDQDSSDCSNDSRKKWMMRGRRWLVWLGLDRRCGLAPGSRTSSPRRTRVGDRRRRLLLPPRRTCSSTGAASRSDPAPAVPPHDTGRRASARLHPRPGHPVLVRPSTRSSITRSGRVPSARGNRRPRWHHRQGDRRSPRRPRRGRARRRYPNVWFYDSVVMSETLILFTTTLTILVAYRFARRPTICLRIGLGVSVGAAALDAPNRSSLVPLLIVPLAFWLREVDWRRRLPALRGRDCCDRDDCALGRLQPPALRASRLPVQQP